MYYVYVWFRPWDGTPCYIGKGKKSRCNEFNRTHNDELKRIVKKAGGKLPCVIVKENIGEEEALLVERAFINAIGRSKGLLVNITSGGQGVSGMKHSKKTRKFLSEFKTKLHKNKKVRKNISDGTKAALADPEVRKRISDAQKKRFVEQGPTRGTLGMTFPNRKKTKNPRPPISENTRNKLSSWQIGRKMSDEARENMREARLRYLTEHPIKARRDALKGSKQGHLSRWGRKES